MYPCTSVPRPSVQPHFAIVLKMGAHTFMTYNAWVAKSLEPKRCQDQKPWAIVLLTRVHANVVARLGIDASYVSQGVANRVRLCKGKNGDLWSLFFSIMAFRTAEIEFAKVSSHLEDVGAQAVEDSIAHICDVIGNELADEAAELTAKLLRPQQTKCKASSVAEAEAFLVCIRIGLAQARLWEASEDALIFEAHESFEAEATSTEIELMKAARNLADSGHELIVDTWGEFVGNRCARCNIFKAKEYFETWCTGPRCEPRTPSLTSC